MRSFPPALASLNERRGIMKTVFDFVRQPLILLACVLSVLIVAVAYFGSHWYYGDVDPMPTPPLALAPGLPSVQASSELDFGNLSDQVESPPTELESKITPSEEKGISIEEFLAELTEAEKQALTEEVTLPRESLYGLGPYPKIPHDYPDQNAWDDLEKLYHDGYGSIGHELIERVLIKLWNQGIKVTAATYNEQDGVIPLYEDTVYVEWQTDDEGNRYLSSFSCHGSLGEYEESVEDGTQPSWIKVVPLEGAGINPYSFLDLP